MTERVFKKLVTTIPDRCRVCYTCVRECPAKAIKLVNGQAEVMHERCIGCGNCVRTPPGETTMAPGPVMILPKFRSLALAMVMGCTISTVAIACAEFDCANETAEIAVNAVSVNNIFCVKRILNF